MEKDFLSFLRLYFNLLFIQIVVFYVVIHIYILSGLCYHPLWREKVFKAI